MNWNQINRMRMRYIRFSEGVFARMFAAVRSEVAQRLRRAQTIADVEGILATVTIDEDLADAFNNVYTRTGTAFARSEYKRFKSGGGYEVKDEFDGMWKEMMLAYVTEKCPIKMKSIKKTHRLTYERLMEDISRQAMDEGWGVEKTSRELLKAGRRKEKWQAMRIARTEVLSASNYGSAVGAETTGIPMVKRWLPSSADDPRPDHQYMAGTEPVDSNKPFILPSGEQLMYPGDPSASLEETINCRCGVAYEPKEDIIEQILAT